MKCLIEVIIELMKLIHILIAMLAIFAQVKASAQPSFELVDLADGALSFLGKKTNVSVDLYEAPKNDSKALGKITYKYQDDVLTGEYQSVGQKSPVQLTADYFQGRCGNSYEVLALQNIIETQGEFSQIGEGPWGKSAWLKAKRLNITDPKSPIKFQMHSERVTSVEIKDDEFLLHMLENRNEPYTVRLSFKSLYKDKKLTLQTSCEKGLLNSAPVSSILEADPTSNSYQGDPMYVSLIPGDFESAQKNYNCSPEGQTESSEHCQIIKEKCEFSNVLRTSHKAKTGPRLGINNSNIWISDVFTHGVKRGFSSIETIYFEGKTNQDIKEFVTLDNGRIVVKPSHAAQFNSLLQDLNFSNLIFKGECIVAKIKPQKSFLGIYAQPNLSSSKLGGMLSIDYNSDNRGLKLSYVSHDGSEIDFHANMFNGSCEALDHKNLYIHQVVSSKDGWSNIGAGPWGQEGWINTKAQSVFGSELKFNYSGRTLARLNKNADGSIQLDSGEGGRWNLPIEEVFLPNGKLKLSISCDLGC